MESTVVQNEPSSGLVPGALVAGKYRVEDQLGRGGMGMVCRVVNERLGRAFAMKTLTGELANHPEWLARFRREAQVCASLRHPNIVDVVDYDVMDDGRPYLVMELLEGCDLAKVIETSAPLPWSDIARLADQILAGLGAAHDLGVVHRDLKPSNVFLSQIGTELESLKILDFGLAKGRTHLSVTMTGEPMGTPAYMSPEQAEGRLEAIGAATDLWAFGVILYELVTSRAAFNGNTLPAIFMQICMEDPPPASSYRPDLPPELEALLSELLRKDWRERPQRASEVRATLRQILSADRFPPPPQLGGKLVPEPVQPAATAQTIAAGSGITRRPTDLRLPLETPESTVPSAGGAVQRFAHDSQAVIAPRPTPTAATSSRSARVLVPVVALATLAILAAAGLWVKKHSAAAPPVPASAGETAATSAAGETAATSAAAGEKRLERKGGALTADVSDVTSGEPADLEVVGEVGKKEAARGKSIESEGGQEPRLRKEPGRSKRRAKPAGEVAPKKPPDTERSSDVERIDGDLYDPVF